jgi:N-methylhydantoinase A
VTDSDLSLGYLNADFFLGGAMRIDLAGAERALGSLSASMGLEASRGTFGIHDVVNENMAGAARVAIAERGRVPQDYALLATGGAAPVHAWHVARKLGVKHVICPPGAGAGSTIGMLMAPARIDRVASFNMPLGGADLSAAEAIFSNLEKDGLAVIRETGADMAKARLRRLADMRYIGQGFEITVALDADFDRQGMLAAFEAAYRNLFGRTPPGAAAQFVALRVSVTAPMPGAGGKLRLDQQNTSKAALKGHREVYFDELGERRSTPVYDRYALTPGTSITGPAVFEENESTFIVGPGARISLLPDGSIMAEYVS